MTTPTETALAAARALVEQYARDKKEITTVMRLERKITGAAQAVMLDYDPSAIRSLRAALAAIDAGEGELPGEGGPCLGCGKSYTAQAVDIAWDSGKHLIGVAECPACQYPALVKMDDPAPCGMCGSPESHPIHQPHPDPSMPQHRYRKEPLPPLKSALAPAPSAAPKEEP